MGRGGSGAKGRRARGHLPIAGVRRHPSTARAGAALDGACDQLDATCRECERGVYQESGLMDDLGGTLHCSECGVQVDRWI